MLDTAPFWRRLEIRLSLTVAVSMFVVVVLEGAYSFYKQEQTIKTHRIEDGRESSMLLAISSASYLISDDLAGLEKLLIQSASDIYITGMEVLRADGQVISKVVRQKGRQPEASYTHSVNKLPTEAEFSIEHVNNSLIVWQPIKSVDMLGWVRIVYSGEQLEAVRHEAWQQTWISGTLVLFCSFLLLHILLRPHVRAIIRTTRFASSLEQADGEQMDVYKGSYEMEQLTTALNSASRNIYLQSKVIKDNQSYITLLLDSIEQAVFGLDVDNNCTFINRSCVEVLGYSSPDELLGKNIVELIAPYSNRENGAAMVTEDIQNTILRETPAVERKAAFTRKAGEQFPVEYWVNPIFRNKQVAGVVVTFFDITLREQQVMRQSVLEKQLQQAQKMEAIGQLTGGIAHDFNNILAYVLGYIELVQEQSAEYNNESIREYLQEAYAGGVRAQELVAQMLAFGRVVKGDACQERLEPLIQSTLKLMESMLPSSIVIETELTEGLGSVMLDSTRFHQIMMNLCLNAKDAMDGHGKLLIKLAQTIVLDQTVCDSCHNKFGGEYQVLSVRDSGGGMSQDIADKIFEPFFTTKGVGKGSGMGLSMVHGLAHEFHGHIRVDSEPGQGTEFQIYFPTGSEAGQKVNAVQSPSVEHHAGKISHTKQT